MSENLYFREPSTQSMLLDILFIYCKLNGDVGYRQGMHEVLAPVLWVVSRDAIDTDIDFEGKSTHEVDDLVTSMLDKTYIEHDTFTIFCIIMQTAKSFYETASTTQQAASGAEHSSPIVERSRRIHEDYLKRTDPELTKHLTEIDILPQIFVMYVGKIWRYFISWLSCANILEEGGFGCYSDESFLSMMSFVYGMCFSLKTLV